MPPQTPKPSVTRYSKSHGGTQSERLEQIQADVEVLMAEYQRQVRAGIARAVKLEELDISGISETQTTGGIP